MRPLMTGSLTLRSMPHYRLSLLTLPSHLPLLRRPTLLTALANHMAWPTASESTLPNAIHFSGFSAGSYTAIALEAEYRLLSNRLQQPLCPGCATLGALGRPIIYLLRLLQPHFCAGDRWHPSLNEIAAVTTPPHPYLPTPNVLIQVLDTGTGPRKPTWLEGDVHNYAHLLHVTVPMYPALLAVQASLTVLCAYKLCAAGCTRRAHCIPPILGGLCCAP